ncbi:hypothetical protein IIA79_07445 [bacterium]|nr:hypothetical protein [bacterium]
MERARMTTYALILEGTTGSLSAGRLRLVFEQAKRMAYEYAKREDNIKVLENAASEVYGAGTAIVLALADGEGSQAEYTPPVQVKQALREKLPDEVLYDVTEKNEPQTIEKSSLDPAQMSGEAQSLTPEIEDGVVDDSGRKPPTAKDVASLFEAEELDEEE